MSTSTTSAPRSPSWASGSSNAAATPSLSRSQKNRRCDADAHAVQRGRCRRRRGHAGEHPPQQGGLGGRAGHRPDGIEGRREAEEAVERNAPEGRLQRGHAAVRGGDADRSAGVGADRQRRHPGGERCGRAGGRAAGRCARDPTGCGPSRRVSLVAAAELVRGRLGDTIAPAARRQRRPRHRRRVPGRGSRASRRSWSETGGVEEVLDDDGRPSSGSGSLRQRAAERSAAASAADLSIAHAAGRRVERGDPAQAAVDDGAGLRVPGGVGAQQCVGRSVGPPLVHHRAADGVDRGGDARQHPGQLALDRGIPLDDVHRRRPTRRRAIDCAGTTPISTPRPGSVRAGRFGSAERGHVRPRTNGLASAAGLRLREASTSIVMRAMT